MFINIEDLNQYFYVIFHTAMRKFIVTVLSKTVIV